MIIFPAIDLRGGNVVRLREGNPDNQLVFSDDPVVTAQGWVAQGAQWLHVVNLDGAFANANDNLAVLKAIARETTAKIQFGGGLRTPDDIRQAVDAGASRVVLGTVALQQPDIVSQALAEFGSSAICVALDARNGLITTHGWANVTSTLALDLGRAMFERGVKYALYTDVSRDGLLTGVDVDGTIALAEGSGLHVIASGGARGLDEIRALRQSSFIEGIVVGMALYLGHINLPEALAIADPSATSQSLGE